jgi:hypothetical protein
MGSWKPAPQGTAKMTTSVELEKVIRGVAVTVYANNFEEDRSVGLNLGPDEMYAKTEDGAEFELTDDEQSALAEEATEEYLSCCQDDDHYP